MTEEQIKRLKKYIKIGKVPMLIKKVPEKIMKRVSTISINSSCSRKELMGKFENYKYISPKWYMDLLNVSKSNVPVLVIENIDKISEKNQRMFIELLKHRKSYVNKLPESCRIFVTYDQIDLVCEELYSYVVKV